MQKLKTTKKAKGIGYYIPIIFIITIVPLISYGKIVELPIEEANFWKGGTTHVDFFNYYKSVALIITTFLSICAYGGLFLDKKLPLQKENRYYIPLLIYVFFAVASTIFSKNMHVSTVGFIEMYQGIFVLLSYVTLTFILINYIRDEMDIKIVIYSFVLITIFEGVLGLSQYFGYDFLKTSIGQWLMAPAGYKGIELNFAFGDYTIYGTLYNSNFVGSFSALVLPIQTSLYLYEKDMKKSIFFGITSLLAFSLWLGCNSRAGYLGITSIFIIGIIIFRKVIKANYKKVLILFIGFMAITLLFNTVSGGRTFNQFSRLNPFNEAERIQNVNNQEQIRFEEVSIQDNQFTIRTNKETLIGVIANENLSFTDEDGEKLQVITDEEGRIKFINEKYLKYSFTINKDQPSIIEADLYGRSWYLYITSDQKFKVISFNNKLTNPIEATRVKFLDGKETFASNRGYIWSRTIPMLKDTIFIGYGPDNYPIAFPQEDYVGRFNVGNSGMTDIVVDKPHNMYLQTAINTGVVSLISLLFIWALYLIESIKLYSKGNITRFYEYMGAATFLSVTAYLVAGLFNDNVVSVAPLFWILLGVGIGINIKVKEA